MTTALYEIETSEADDGTMVPSEGIWTPEGKEAVSNGFVVYRGLYVADLSDPTVQDGLYPAGFVVLAHQRWSDVIEAAAAYMDRIHGWRNLPVYPGDDSSVLIPRVPRAVHAFGVFLRHPHPDHPCDCEWEGAWRMVYAPPTEPGAIPVTAMRHPAAPVTAAGLPDPDRGAPAAWAP